MTDDKKREKWMLPNGNTFLAITVGHYGAWARATDPVTAIRDVYKRNGSWDKKEKEAISVFYGDGETLSCGDMGGYSWSLSKPPTPIGLFLVGRNSIHPMKKGVFNDEHHDHLGWMEESARRIETRHKEWVKTERHERLDIQKTKKSNGA